MKSGSLLRMKLCVGRGIGMYKTGTIFIYVYGEAMVKRVSALTAVFILPSAGIE